VGLADALGLGEAVGEPLAEGEGVGMPSHTMPVVLLLRGLGEPLAKSAELLSVSMQPLIFLRSAVVLVSVGAAAAPSKQDALP
jgi:hypothetical protein